MNAIVVGTDGSRGAETAMLKLIELNPGQPRSVTVHLVCAFPGPSTWSGSAWAPGGETG